MTLPLAKNMAMLELRSIWQPGVVFPPRLIAFARFTEPESPPLKVNVPLVALLASRATVLPANVVAKLPGSPENLKRSFLQDVNWWDENRAKVNSLWSKWILS